MTHILCLWQQVIFENLCKKLLHCDNTGLQLVCSRGGAQWRHLAAVPATSNAQIEVKFTRRRAPDYGHQLRQKAFVLSRRVLRTYYVVSDPQINFAKPAENWWFVSKATSYVEVRLSFNSIYLCTYTLYVHMYLGTGYSFWDWLRNFLLKFTWIVLLVHKLNKLAKFW